MSEPKPSLKRKRVSPTNKTQEVSDSKRKRILLSTDQKTLVYQYWYNCMLSISKIYNPDEYLVARDVNWSCQIMAIFYSVHNLARQIGNKQKDVTALDTKTASFKYNGKNYSKPMKEVYDVMIAEATALTLVYKKFSTNTDDNWISIAAALFTFCHNFKNRMKEVRVGHSKIQVGKTQDEVSYVTASDYGIDQAHHVLLEGSSYPPNVKSSVAQSLGPATLMIMVMEKGNEPKYGDKWKDALTQALGTLPDKEMFVKCLLDTSISQNKALVQLVCDILLLTTTKQIHRAYMAPCFLFVILSKINTETNKYEFDDSMPKKFNNTGRGLFASYNNKLSGVEFSMRTALDASNAGQLCFHSIFGTYTDNLLLLSEVTNLATWSTRNEFGDKIKGLGVDAMEVKFELPKFKYWAKMASAMQTTMLGNTIQEVMPNSAFSGKTRVKWNKTMNDYYHERLHTATSYSKPVNAAALKEKYMMLLQEIYNEINKGNGFDKGTTVWHAVTGEIAYENAKVGRDKDETEWKPDVNIKLFLSGDQD